MWFYQTIPTVLFGVYYFRVPVTALPAVQIAARQMSLAPRWPTQSFKTTNFTPPVLNISRSGPTEEGLLFFAPLGSPPTIAAPLIMSDDGQLIWNGPVQSFPKAALGFQAQKLGNSKVLTYWNGISDNVSQQRGYGAISILDDTYTEIHHVSLDRGSFVTTDNATYDSYLDVHEDFITDRETIIVVATNVTRADLSSVGGPKNGWILDCLLYEIDIKTNEVRFSWSAYEHIRDIPFNQSLYPLHGTGYNQSVPWNYFVMNSVQLFGDNYIISSRYYCSVYSVNSEGNLNWHLQGQTGGDFHLESGTQFCYQHDVRAESSESNGLLLHMHNNKNDDLGASVGPTTGLLLSLDLESRQAAAVSSFSNPKDQIYSLFMGSYQPLNEGHVFLGHGYIPQVVEFDATGTEVYAATFGNVNTTFSYRAFRQAWLGQPNTLPDTFACAMGNGTTAVYMSWNGATAYTEWAIYGGKSADSLYMMDVVDRTGFETQAEIGSVAFVQVAAVVGNTRLSTRSSVVAVQQKC
ncbi:hypothetical protein MMC11_008479 [Xylographa trunciseda]|nr:hypothetical protein [Xylographa trunciseda]